MPERFPSKVRDPADNNDPHNIGRREPRAEYLGWLHCRQINEIVDHCVLGCTVRPIPAGRILVFLANVHPIWSSHPFNPRSESPLKTSSHALGSNAGTTSKNLRKRNINARIHIGAQIAPSSFDNSLCVLLTIHCIPRINRRSSSSRLQPKLKCTLDRDNKSSVHLLEPISRPDAITAQQLF